MHIYIDVASAAQLWRICSLAHGAVWTLPGQPYFGQHALIATAPAWPSVRLRLGLRHPVEQTSSAAWEPRWDARGEVEHRLASYLPWERSQDSSVSGGWTIQGQVPEQLWLGLSRR